MTKTSDGRTCPFCKEEIKADAIKCKHCRSAIAPERPGHGGTCPLCKESVHPDAIRCKHCGSDIGPIATDSRSGDCGCGGASSTVRGWSTVPEMDATGIRESFEGVSEGAPGVMQAPSGGSCGACEADGGWGISGNSLFVRRSRTCCVMVPFWIHGRVIWKKVCWSQRCSPQVVPLSGT